MTRATSPRRAGGPPGRTRPEQPLSLCDGCSSRLGPPPHDAAADAGRNESIIFHTSNGTSLRRACGYARSTGIAARAVRRDAFHI